MMDRRIDQEKFATSMLQEDDRIRVLHLQNGGLSNTRNTGVKATTTDWIIFLDSDDYYDIRTVEYLVWLKRTV